MKNGYIKLWLSLLNNELFTNENPRGLKIWIWCLMKANWKDSWFMIGKNKIYINKGEFITGTNKAVKELGIPRSTFWRWIEVLIVGRYIRVSKTPKYSIITIVNWDKYQSENSPSGTLNGNILNKREREEDYNLPIMVNSDRLFGNH